ncbi:MAG: hypothetical protein H7145_21435 [Akkermansiaceae bacterium]|nr:hypothetical protein [Armatimonadota bacterium]
MLSVLSNESIKTQSRFAGGSRRANAPVKDDPFAQELAVLRRDLGTLACACADGMTKAAQHYHDEDLWVIGTMPGYGPLADTVEATSRGFLANSHLSATHTELVANTMRMSGDLRTAARGARQSVQIAFLLRQEPVAGQEALALLAPMAEAAVAVGERTAYAVQTGDGSAAKQAAQAYRNVDMLRIQVEKGVRTGEWDTYFTPVLQKMIRAAAWNFAVSGESMARVAARLIL